MRFQARFVGLVACVVALGVALMPQSGHAVGGCNVNPPTQQTALARPIPLGISGGNIHSIIKEKHKNFSCFSGTLGSMVQDASDNQYILSNNHVLADQNKAKRGQAIVQPGLVDVQCLRSPGDEVATFSRAVKLKFGPSKNRVDAAIAAVVPGQVDPEILFIGETASTPATPTISMPVQKMGRTSCLTTGKVALLNANAIINYSETRKPKFAKFVNQIVVTGSTATPVFSAPGDSGSLILTQGACPQPVALLFAGSSDGSVTIANPISTVLDALSVSMVGTCTPVVRADTAPAEDLAGDLGLSNEAVASTTSVRDRHEDELMSIAGAVGTGIGAGDQAGQPTIVVYVKKLTPEAEAAAPKEVEGVPVKLIANGGFVAY